MTSSSEFLLNLLLNACWQVTLLAAAASLIAWFLKDSSARYLHLVWCVALLLSMLMPLLGSAPQLLQSNATVATTSGNRSDATLPATATFDSSQIVTNAFASFHLSQTLAFILLSIYAAVVVYRTISLLKAAHVTRKIRRSATTLAITDELAPVVERCALAAGVNTTRVTLLESNRVHLPVTCGIFRPVILLPANLVRELNSEIITTALGHEMVHVARRDYFFNLVFELLHLPLSFHPCAALIRSRIKQTRELSCDEIVSRRILKAEAYARSLVKLASSAPPFNRLSVTTTVGIADADILETRIMSILRKPKINARWKRISLTTLSLVVLVMCVAAASFAMRFDVAADGSPARNSAQQEQEREKAQRDKEQSEKQRTVEIRTRMPGATRGFSEDELDPAERAEIERKRQIEMEMREKTHTALVRVARITMEQAIQVATSQTPGKVLECSLIGEPWEEPGKLSKDATVFYHVVMVSGDDNVPGATHVFVNALDGSIYKIEKEFPRRMRTEQPQ